MPDPLDANDLAAEVAGTNFKDERLNKRLKSLVQALAVEPGVSLPSSLDEAGLEAAYRFFSNPRVTPDDILSSHIDATRARGAAEQDFLIVHDTTDFSYRYDGQKEGLGRAQYNNHKSKQVFFAHFSLMVAADGTRRPLGVAAIKTWVRGTSRSGTEAMRWEAQALVTAERFGNRKKAIHVMDREADDYEMLTTFVQGGHRFIVRCHHDRLLEQEPKVRIREAVSSFEPSSARKAQISARKKHRVANRALAFPERQARLTDLVIAAKQVSISKPSTPGLRPQVPASLPLNIVHVRERNTPPGEKPIDWVLLTNDPVDTPEQQEAIVDRYRARWTIEEYFKAIKTGCDFERRQLRDYESLLNLLATFAPIAYRMLLIRSEARRSPEAAAVDVLTQDHIDVLRAVGRRVLSDAPTVREIYLAVAALGGHIKYAPDPGWLTLSRGLEKLESLVEGWVAAKLQQSSDQR